MTYRFIYDRIDAARVLPSVLIDKRAAIDAISGKTGAIIKAYTDAQVAELGVGSLFYKIETDGGNLAGYFTVNVNNEDAGSLFQFELRPAFEQFSAVISQQISNFISGNGWLPDYLN